ncbi:hypothetical protein H8957_014335, partial [Semnopithecus entellus]
MAATRSQAPAPEPQAILMLCSPPGSGLHPAAPAWKTLRFQNRTTCCSLILECMRMPRCFLTAVLPARTLSIPRPPGLLQEVLTRCGIVQPRSVLSWLFKTPEMRAFSFPSGTLTQTGRKDFWKHTVDSAVLGEEGPAELWSVSPVHLLPRWSPCTLAVTPASVAPASLLPAARRLENCSLHGGKWGLCGGASVVGPGLWQCCL